MTAISSACMTWLRPENWRLILVAVALQVLLIVGPAAWSLRHMAVVLGVVLLGPAVIFSVRRTMVVVTALAVILPAHFVDSRQIPLGLRLEEILLLAGVLFACIDLVHRRSLWIRRSPLDGAVLAFLVIALLSGLVGLHRGHEVSLVLRNLRFPLYYIAFFLVVQSVDARTVVRVFVPLLVLSGVIVSLEYILEFIGAIDLSAGHRFVRVGRRQGLVLPVALLLVANQYVHDPRRWGRAASLGIFAIMGLSLVLTVGRGMWVAFALGLGVTIWLRPGRDISRRSRAWRSAVLTVAVLALLAGVVFSFQRVTGAAISAHAVERSRTFVDYTRDVQAVARILNYGTALEAIAKHPILGSGQGTTLTCYSFDPHLGQYQRWTSWSLDSLYLTLWLKMGLPGLLAFSWLCLQVLRLALRTMRSAVTRETRAFAAGAVAVMVAMLTLGLSDGSMINGRFALVFAVLFGLVVCVSSTADEMDEMDEGDAAHPAGA